MLNFTDKAKARILQFLEAQRAQGVSALRLAGSQGEPKLWLTKEEDARADDVRFEVQGEGGRFPVFVDPLSARAFGGATVDFVENVMTSGFRVFFPSPSWDDPVAQAVQDVIDRQINPGVAGHGGKVALRGVEDGVAYITLGGGCQGCAAADVTLKQGIEVMIKEAVPQVRDVVDSTDHAGGTNPYYRGGGQGESPLG